LDTTIDEATQRIIMTKLTSVLVTGANAGLGKDCARQLGLKEGVKKVYLGCRNEERARAAKEDLEKSTGKKDVFEIVLLDVSQPDSVKNAVGSFQGTLDGLVLNAGGKGGADHMAQTDYGVPAIVAINVLGHVLLVDELLKSKKLVSGGSVVFSGSEAARGIPMFDMPKPTFENGSVEEYTKYVDGSAYVKDRSFEATYGPTKYLGAMFMSSMARKEPSIRFVTMSPGASTGTNAASEMTFPKKMMFQIVMPIMQMMGKMHNTETGAKRYVDALEDDETYKTGRFYASKKGFTGELADQVTFNDDFENETYQDNANEALHKFLK